MNRWTNYRLRCRTGRSRSRRRVLLGRRRGLLFFFSSFFLSLRFLCFSLWRRQTKNSNRHTFWFVIIKIVCGCEGGGRFTLSSSLDERHLDDFFFRLLCGFSSSDSDDDDELDADESDEEEAADDDDDDQSEDDEGERETRLDDLRFGELSERLWWCRSLDEWCRLLTSRCLLEDDDDDDEPATAADDDGLRWSLLRWLPRLSRSSSSLRWSDERWWWWRDDDDDDDETLSLERERDRLLVRWRCCRERSLVERLPLDDDGWWWWDDDDDWCEAHQELLQLFHIWKTVSLKIRYFFLTTRLFNWFGGLLSFFISSTNIDQTTKLNHITTKVVKFRPNKLKRVFSIKTHAFN